MKTLNQIAKECDIEKRIIYRIVVRDNISCHKFNYSNKNFYDQEQEEYIHKTLYFEGRINHIILPSKINTM